MPMAKMNAAPPCLLSLPACNWMVSSSTGRCKRRTSSVVKPRAENPALRNTTVISEGQVFTIEPGIYFIEALLAPVRNGPNARDVDWKLVDALAPLGGVRIEDDVVVEAHGTRNLTREVLRDGGGRA